MMVQLDGSLGLKGNNLESAFLLYKRNGDSFFGHVLTLTNRFYLKTRAQFFEPNLFKPKLFKPKLLEPKPGSRSLVNRSRIVLAF